LSCFNQLCKYSILATNLKNFALCDKSGRMLLDFEIYQGAVEQEYQMNQTIFRLGGSAVMHLEQTVYFIQPKLQALFR